MKANGRVLLSGNTGFTLPTTIGELNGITKLDLANCSLTGEISAELGNLDKIHFVDLRGNSLVGPVPEAVLKMSGILLPKLMRKRPKPTKAKRVVTSLSGMSMGGTLSTRRRKLLNSSWSINPSWLRSNRWKRRL